jgi:sec-independent protein translocase protein TatA
MRPLLDAGLTPLEVSMPGKLGLPEILLILAVALLLFGPSKIGALGKGLGEGIRNFKSAVKEGEEGEGGGEAKKP